MRRACLALLLVLGLVAGAGAQPAFLKPINIQQAGVFVGSRINLNFVSGATCVDNATNNRVDCTISGGGGGTLTNDGSGASPRIAFWTSATTLAGDADLTFDGVHTTLQAWDKGGFCHNVKAYGAVGDGTTDDTAAIQAALDAGGNGSCVELPVTTSGYKITAPLLLYESQILRGATTGGSDPATDIKGAWLKPVTTGQTAIKSKTAGVSRQDSIRIRDLGIRLDSAGAGSIGIDLTHVNQAEVAGCAIAGNTAAGQIGILIASNGAASPSGGLGELVTGSSLFLLDVGVKITNAQANMNWIGEGNRIYTNNVGIQIDGLCSCDVDGNGTKNNDPCTSDADCASCGGTCAVNQGGLTTSGVNNHLINNWIERNTTHVLDWGGDTVIAHNYMEEACTPSCSGIFIAEHGLRALIQGNFFSGNTADTGVESFSTTGSVRIMDNEFFAVAITSYAEAAPSTLPNLYTNNVVASGTRFLLDPATKLRWNDTLGVSKTNLTAGVAAGHVYCSDCKLDVGCAAGGTGAWASKLTVAGAWNCAPEGWLDSASGDQRVAFDDGGFTGFDADFTWDKTLNSLTLGSTFAGILNGGTAASLNLVIHSTSNATKGRVLIGSTIGLDETNGFLGLGGVTAPAVPIHLTQDQQTEITRIDDYNSAVATGPQLIARRARSTLAACPGTPGPCAVTSGDQLFVFTGRGHDGTAFTTGGRASVTLNAAENWSSTANGTDVRFLTTLAGTTTQCQSAAFVGGSTLQLFEPQVGSACGTEFTGIRTQAQGAGINPVYILPAAGATVAGQVLSNAAGASPQTLSWATAGTVTASGPPASPQIAFWTSPTNLTGDADLTFDGVHTTLQAWDKGGAVYNVKAYGAVGNDTGDDAAAIQAAADAAFAAGGGIAYLPCGTYRIQCGIELDDYVTLQGAGKCAVLKRGTTACSQTTYTTGCVPTSSESQRAAIRNKKKDCSGTGIAVRDLGIDGSLITTMPCTSCSAGPTTPSVMMVFSGVTDLLVDNVLLSTTPQDAIFIKNAGGRTVVSHTTIDGHDMRWGNGHGINVEMRTTGNVPGVANFSDNYIVSRGPNFCDADLSVPCTVDGDCPSGVCGNGAGAASVGAIFMTYVDTSQQPPQALIARNRIETTDRHVGIAVTGPNGVTIAENRIAAYNSGTALAKIFTGIQLNGAASKPAQDTLIVHNEILGGNVSSDKRGIFVDDATSGSRRIVVQGNVIRDKSLTGLAAITFRGVTDGLIEGNTIQNVAAGHGIEIGSGSTTTVDVQVRGNQIIDVTGGSQDCLRLLNTTRVSVAGNTFSNCARALDFASATISGTQLLDNTYTSVTTLINFGVTDTAFHWLDTSTANGTVLATLPSTIADGSMRWCTDCKAGNPAACATAGPGTTGAIARRLNSVWVCGDPGVPAGNNGQVQYATTSSGSAVFDATANLRFDAAQRHLLVGNLATAPDLAHLHTHEDAATGGSSQHIFSDHYGTAATGIQWQGRRAQGSEGVPAAVNDLDELLVIGADGYDGSAFTAPKARMAFLADPTGSGTWSATDNGTAIDLDTTGQGDTAKTRARRVRVADDGSVLLGTTTKQSGAILVSNNGNVELRNIANASCTAFGVPASCCTGSGAGTCGGAAELRWFEPIASGTNYTAFKAGVQGGNITYVLPATRAASAGQVLSSDGAVSDPQTLSWATAGTGTVTNVTPGTATQVAYFKAANDITSEPAFFWDPTLKTLQIDPTDANPSAALLIGTTSMAADITVSRTSAGAIGTYVENLGAGDAFTKLVAQSVGGNAYSTFTISGGATWTFGVHNADSDAFKLSRSSALGSSDVLRLPGVGTQGDILKANASGVLVPFARGTANQVLGVNGTPNDLEYKTIQGVANETDVVHGAGTITVGLIDPVIATKGGTGFASYAVGNVLYADTTTTLAKLAFTATATRYLANTGGGATIPAWDQVDWLTGVKGGATNALPYFTSATAGTTLAPATGVLHDAGAAPSWSAVVAGDFGSQTANTFLAAPNGANGAPTFRTHVTADLVTTAYTAVLHAALGGM